MHELRWIRATHTHHSFASHKQDPEALPWKTASRIFLNIGDYAKFASVSRNHRSRGWLQIVLVSVRIQLPIMCVCTHAVERIGTNRTIACTNHSMPSQDTSSVCSDRRESFYEHKLLEERAFTIDRIGSDRIRLDWIAPRNVGNFNNECKQMGTSLCAIESQIWNWVSVRCQFGGVRGWFIKTWGHFLFDAYREISMGKS